MKLPELRFRPKDGKATPQEETIQLVEPPVGDPAGELQPQQQAPTPAGKQSSQ